MFVFVKCHQAGQRHGCRLQTQVEHQEVARRNHDVHAEKRKERQHVILAHLVLALLLFERLAHLQEHQQRSQAQDGFHQRSHAGRLEHPAEKFAFRHGEKAAHYVQGYQHESDRLEIFPPDGSGHQVVHQQNEGYRQQRNLGSEKRKYAIEIHLYFPV